MVSLRQVNGNQATVHIFALELDCELAVANKIVPASLSLSSRQMTNSYRGGSFDGI